MKKLIKNRTELYKGIFLCFNLPSKSKVLIMLIAIYVIIYCGWEKSMYHNFYFTLIMSRVRRNIIKNTYKLIFSMLSLVLTAKPSLFPRQIIILNKNIVLKI